MINDFMEWILSKMQLVDVDDSNEQLSEIVAMEEKTWSELMPRKKRRAIEKANGRIYCKNVMDYNDCKLIIEHYKLGTVCIYILDPMQNPESQNMMCYLCGGIYALGGGGVFCWGKCFCGERCSLRKCFHKCLINQAYLVVFDYLI